MLPFDSDSEFVVVLGYDGTDTAQRALEHVARVMRGQLGWVQVVTVTGEGDDPDATLPVRVQHTLAGTNADWRFESRHGVLADELVAVARELLAHDPRRGVVIVVGRPGSHHPSLDDSVLAALFRSSSYPVLVVP